MRRVVGIGLVTVLLLPSLPAWGVDFSACWVVREFNPVFGDYEQITRCRISGGDIVDYASDTGVPGRLYPRPGTDINGPCWYYSSTDANWLFAELYSDGDAILGYSAGKRGGFAVVIGRVPRCTSEPTRTSEPVADVWSYVTEYIHPPPQPDLSPPGGDGVTGLETFVGVLVPDPHTARISGGGGALLDVEIEVSGITIDWGDGSSSTFPATSSAMAGYPDGIATHIYETKDNDITVSVSYDWTARWRVAGGAWLAVAVPDTSTSVAYPVSEIVSVITN